MERSDCLEVKLTQRVTLKCAEIMSGQALSVMTFGTTKMQQWSVDSLDSLVKVNKSPLLIG